MGQKPRIAPWQKGPMPAEQVATYRKAIAPLQESLAAAKAARREVFKWIKPALASAQA